MEPKDTVSLGISFVALVVSFMTAWATLWRRGRVSMTQPTLLFFGYERHVDSEGARLQPKIYLRTMLFSTGQRGNVVESMFVRLTRGETVQAFPIWVLGEGQLSRGSGLFVGETGITCNHHFLSPRGTEFLLREGEYTMDVLATLFPARRHVRLITLNFAIRESDAREISAGQAGLFYDWSSESRRYSSHVDPTPLISARSFAQATPF